MTTELPTKPAARILRHDGTADARRRTLRAPGAVALVLAAPVAAWWFTRGTPPWVVMWAVASAEYLAVKALTPSGFWRMAPVWRVIAYLTLWPGMDAAAFLGVRGKKAVAPVARAEWMFAGAKFTGGLAAVGWAATHASTGEPMFVGWVGMLGLIFSLHFGLFHLASAAWRTVGVAAVPIMHAPILAGSLAEFWGERWNAAFADVARRFLMRPLARRHGGAWAGAIVFLVSGLVHESVISLPAGGGWGGPFLYFALQAAGAWFEKSAPGRALGLGRGLSGRLWTILVTLAPVPLLFHAMFVTRVMTPFFATLGTFLP